MFNRGPGSDGKRKITLHFPKLLHDSSLTIRLVKIISRSLVRWVEKESYSSAEIRPQPAELINRFWIQSFYFSYNSYYTIIREPSLPYYLPIAGERIVRFIPFPKGISAMWNAKVLSRIWNSGQHVRFPLTDTITPQILGSYYYSFKFNIHDLA